MSTSLARRFARLLLRHRAWFALAALAVTLLAALGARRIEADFTFWKLLGSRSGELETLERFHERFGNHTAQSVLLVEADDVLAPRTLELIDELSRALAELDGIEEVDSLTTIDDVTPSADGFEIAPLISSLPLDDAGRERVRGRVRANRLLRESLVSESFRVTAVAARIRPTLERIEDRGPVVHAIRDLVAATTARFPEARVHLTGLPELEQVMLELGSDQRVKLTGLSMLAVALLLMAMFRNVFAVMIPAAVLMTVILWTMGLIGWTSGKLNLLTALVPSLLVVVGVADAIHLISRYFEELRAGRSKHEALESAVAHLSVACLLTSVTTAIGFGSMVTSELPELRRFGLYLAGGVMLAYVATVTLVPVLLSFAPAPGAPRRQADRSDGWDRFLSWLAAVTTTRPVAIVVLFVGLSLGAVALATQVRLETRAMQELPETNPVVVATRLAEREMQGVLAFDIELEAAPDAVLDPAFLRSMAEIQRLLEQDPMVTSTDSITDVLAQLNRAVHDDDAAFEVVPETRELAAQLLLLYSMSGDPEELRRLVSADHGHTHVTAHLRDLGSTYFFPMFERIRPEVEKRFGGRATIRYTGESYVANTGILKIVRSMMSSLGLAFACILACMAVTFRSFKVGLISMVPNVLPAAATLAAMVVLDTPLRMATSMICAVALGIAVDDTIHILARLRAELHGEERDYPAAIRRTLLGTGRPVVYTTVGLVAGFLIMLTSEFRAWFDFGALSAIALTSALAADLFFTPSVMLLLHPHMDESAVDREDAAAG